MIGCNAAAIRRAVERTVWEDDGHFGRHAELVLSKSDEAVNGRETCCWVRNGLTEILAVSQMQSLGRVVHGFGNPLVLGAATDQVVLDGLPDAVVGSGGVVDAVDDVGTGVGVAVFLWTIASHGVETASDSIILLEDGVEAGRLCSEAGIEQIARATRAWLGARPLLGHAELVNFSPT